METPYHAQELEYPTRGCVGPVVTINMSTHVRTDTLATGLVV